MRRTLAALGLAIIAILAHVRFTGLAASERRGAGAEVVRSEPVPRASSPHHPKTVLAKAPPHNRSRRAIDGKPGARISGEVVDEFGDPVAGVRIETERYSVLVSRGECPAHLYILTGNGRGRCGPADSATDESGRFVVDPAKPACQCEYLLTFRKTEYAPVNVRTVPGDEQVLVRMVAVARVSGRVLGRDGAPVSDAIVTAARPKDVWTPDEGMSSRTTADGRFTLEGISPGDVRLDAWVPGTVPAPYAERRVSNLLPRESREGLLLRLSTPAHSVIRVALRQPDGSPAAGAWVDCDRPTYSSHVRTDRRGEARLVLECRPCTKVRLYVQEDGTTRHHDFDVVAQEPGRATRIALHLPKLRRVELAVRGSNGERLPKDLKVKTDGVALGPHRFLRNIAVKAGHAVAFSASADGYAPGQIESAAESVEIRLRRPATIVGRVVDPRGKPAPAGIRGGGDWAGTKSDGSFTLNPPPGRHTVEVEHGPRRTVNVAEGETVDLGTLRLPESTTVRGRVFLPSGSAATGAQVWILGLRRGRLEFRTTGRNGSFFAEVPNDEPLCAIAWKRGFTAALSPVASDGFGITLHLQAENVVQVTGRRDDPLEVRTARGFLLPLRVCFLGFPALVDQETITSLPAGRLSFRVRNRDAGSIVVKPGTIHHIRLR